MCIKYGVLFVIHTRTLFYACLSYDFLLQHPLQFYTTSIFMATYFMFNVHRLVYLQLLKSVFFLWEYFLCIHF